MPTIHFDCKEGKHLEAKEMYSRSRNYCWGWSKTHTYQFSDTVNVTKIVGEINTGPREYSTYYRVKVKLSEDGKNWVTVGEKGAKGSEGYVPFSIDVGGVPAKYLRFETVTGYVDGSRGDVYYEAPTPPTPPPECIEGATKCVGYDLYKCIGGKWQLVERNSEQCGYQPPSPPSPGYAHIYGTVKDILGRPIPGAEIYVNGLSTTTDNYGRFTLDIPLITAVKVHRLIMVKKEGYITHYKDIEFEQGETIEMTIYLIPKMAIYIGAGLATLIILYAIFKK